MVGVADRVWTRWRELEEFRKAAIVLLFSSTLQTEDAVEAVRSAAGDAIVELENSVAGGPLAEAHTGAWRAAIGPDGVLLEIGEGPEDFEGLMASIAAGLERRGVEGSFDLFEPLEVPEPKGPVVECRLRVRGERYHIRYANYGWKADPECLWGVLSAGVEGCSAAPGLELSLQVRTLPRVMMGAGDPQLLRDAIAGSEHLGVFDVTSFGVGRFRSVAVEPSFGRVTLIEGGERLGLETWPAALAELTGFMRTTSAMTVYGFIKHSPSWLHAKSAWSIEQNWPRRVDMTAGHLEPFEDIAAPDAFAVQLLGPGYAGRVPHVPSWRRTEIGPGQTVLEHVRPEDWFDMPITVTGRDAFGRRVHSVPEVLASARAELEPILFTPDLAVAR